jgi:hypothetical protein
MVSVYSFVGQVSGNDIRYAVYKATPIVITMSTADSDNVQVRYRQCSP